MQKNVLFEGHTNIEIQVALFIFYKLEITVYSDLQQRIAPLLTKQSP